MNKAKDAKKPLKVTKPKKARKKRKKKQPLGFIVDGEPVQKGVPKEPKPKVDNYKLGYEDSLALYGDVGRN